MCWVADNGRCPVRLTWFIFSSTHTPFHRCRNNNPVNVLMGIFSTHCSLLSPSPLIDCFNLKITPVIYLFLAYLFHWKGSCQVEEFQFPELLATKNCRMSLIMAFPSISLTSTSPDIFFFFFLPLASAVSQSLYSSERGDRSNRQTFGISCEEMCWSPKIKLAVQLSPFVWRNVFSCTNARYQVTASTKVSLMGMYNVDKRNMWH